MTEAEGKLKGMLEHAKLPVRASYCRGEVCEILGIDKRTFWRMVAHHEPTADGQRKPGTLDSYMTRGHHRVRYDELVSYLHRNRTWQRQNAVDPRQQSLF